MVGGGMSGSIAFITLGVIFIILGIAFLKSPLGAGLLALGINLLAFGICLLTDSAEPIFWAYVATIAIVFKMIQQSAGTFIALIVTMLWADESKDFYMNQAALCEA
jgi:hypothetical protein